MAGPLTRNHVSRLALRETVEMSFAEPMPMNGYAAVGRGLALTVHFEKSVQNLARRVGLERELKERGQDVLDEPEFRREFSARVGRKPLKQKLDSITQEPPHESFGSILEAAREARNFLVHELLLIHDAAADTPEWWSKVRDELEQASRKLALANRILGSFLLAHGGSATGVRPGTPHSEPDVVKWVLDGNE